MTEYRCRCGEPLCTLAVDGPVGGSYVLTYCDHCDQPCRVPRCQSCRTADRAQVTPPPD